VGSEHACAIKNDGYLTCWGSNAQGQATPEQGIFDGITTYGQRTCGIREDGVALCWGAGDAVVGENTTPQW
jgi:alpha-tubulin suppressor-like RCC1 family protein